MESIIRYPWQVWCYFEGGQLIIGYLFFNCLNSGMLIKENKVLFHGSYHKFSTVYTFIIEGTRRKASVKNQQAIFSSFLTIFLR